MAMAKVGMGQCDVCSKQMEYNAVDSDDLMLKLQNTPLGKAITKLRADNRQAIANCKFFPMPDKSFYKGKMKDAKRDGYGQNYANCFNYFGFFKNDLPHGTGAIITKEQCLYGQFKAGVLEGSGRQWKNGVSFQGQYHQGERKEGKLYGDQCSYSGSFKQNMYHGQGTLMLRDNLQYKGTFKDGKFHGRGELTFQSKSKYRGSFKDGLYDGYGEFTWTNGNFYRGQYKSGKYQGFGVLRLGGIEYSGTWREGQREGHGILTEEKEMGFGEWKKNMLTEQA